MEFLGKNLSWLLLGGAIIAGCGQPPPIIIDDAELGCMWVQGGRDYNRASFSPSASSDSARLLWSRGFKRGLCAEPTAAYGKILIPAADRRLYIISSFDGAEVMEKKYKKDIVAPVIISDSLAVLIEEGERLTVENWIIHQALWEAELNGSFIEPLIMDDNVYWLDGRNFVRCYRLRDGIRVWERKLEGHYSATITGSSEGLLLAGDNGVIHCIEKDSGNHLWEYRSGRRMRNPPIIVNNDLIFCTADGIVGRLRAADGAVSWKTDIESPVRAPVASDGEGIFIGTTDRYIYRLDFDTGEVIWKKKIGGPVNAGPALTDKIAVFVGIDYAAYFVDKISGRILYRFEAEGMLTMRPLACNGRVYIAGEDKKLYCFNTAGAEENGY